MVQRNSFINNNYIYDTYIITDNNLCYYIYIFQTRINKQKEDKNKIHHIFPFLYVVSVLNHQVAINHIDK